MRRQGREVGSNRCMMFEARADEHAVPRPAAGLRRLDEHEHHPLVEVRREPSEHPLGEERRAPGLPDLLDRSAASCSQARLTVTFIHAKAGRTIRRFTAANRARQHRSNRRGEARRARAVRARRACVADAGAARVDRGISKLAPVRGAGRAQLAGIHRRLSALRHAYSRVSEAILSSGATVIVALLTLLLAQLGLYKSLGPSLAIGVAVMLLVGLTLVPALLSIVGRAAFWPFIPKYDPAMAGPSQEKIGLWGRLARMVANMADLSSEIVHGAAREEDPYHPTIPMHIPKWLISEEN